MAAGLGFYRAVEVATTLIDSPSDLTAADEAELPAEGEATTDDVVDPLPALEQATSDSETGNTESTKAASMPFWLGAVAIFSRGRRKRKTKGLCVRTALRREQ